jgi:hypothetical protein
VLPQQQESEPQPHPQPLPPFPHPQLPELLFPQQHKTRRMMIMSQMHEKLLLLLSKHIDVTSLVVLCLIL